MARVSSLPVFCAREGPVEFCVAGSRTPLCREDYIVPCGNTQHPPAGGSGCLCGETSLDIMLFPTAWVFPVDDTGNATYWSVVVPVPLSFFYLIFFPLPPPWRDFCGKRKWKRCPVPALEGGSKSACSELMDPQRTEGTSVSAEVQQPAGHLARGLGQVTDQDPS